MAGHDVSDGFGCDAMREPEPLPQNAEKAEAGRPGDEGALRARLEALKADLGETIAREQAEKASQSEPEGNASALGAGMRAASELVAGILVGTGIGFLLDRTFGTKPLFLIILMMLGMAAGFVNIYRLGNRPTVVKPGSRGSEPIRDRNKG
jgi:ATP synthase protein I